MPKRNKISVKQSDAIFSSTDGRCWYCGVRLVKWSGRYENNVFVTDHVIPLSKGGADKSDNMVPSCWKCNCQKRAMTLEEFRLSYVRKQGGVFTVDQIEFWLKRGVKLPVFPKKELPVFFGEEMF